MTTIAVLIYMGVHKEKSIRSYWESPKPSAQRAEHSFVKFISVETVRRGGPICWWLGCGYYVRSCAPLGHM
jgi:hypothetical protein